MCVRGCAFVCIANAPALGNQPPVRRVAGPVRVVEHGPLPEDFTCMRFHYLLSIETNGAAFVLSWYGNRKKPTSLPWRVSSFGSARCESGRFQKAHEEVLKRAAVFELKFVFLPFVFFYTYHVLPLLPHGSAQGGLDAEPVALQRSFCQWLRGLQRSSVFVKKPKSLNARARTSTALDQHHSKSTTTSVPSWKPRGLLQERPRACSDKALGVGLERRAPKRIQ